MIAQQHILPEVKPELQPPRLAPPLAPTPAVTHLTDDLIAPIPDGGSRNTNEETPSALERSNTRKWQIETFFPYKQNFHLRLLAEAVGALAYSHHAATDQNSFSIIKILITTIH